MTASEPLVPTLLWGQDKEHIYATINVPDLESADVSFEETKLTFSGSKGERSGDAKEYQMSIELAHPINTSACNWAKRPRNVQIVMAKKESDTKWAQFAKDAKRWKAHISVDWNKWVDSDDEDDVPGRFDDMKDLMGGGMDFSSMMKGASGIPGDINANEEDSDDDLPELEETPAQAPAETEASA
ncbi:CS domain-containing protein [Plasmodiophora brassicae]|uniref:CS domain-containing protein n=1 Tax=Plasmodiophora brassicae TaxID=37360 RepID=A0A0G4J395_PLABS|nr:hypothetical protein PBRA_002267 [Plasmodiophora brassicae]SPQ98859.1 unnamed protein product [Plasmodiophora brassicae]